MNTEKPPQTDSIQELAHFWDTHELTDFEDELEEVAEPVFERETVVKILLPTEEAIAGEEIAKLKGVGFDDLIKQWVLEKIHTT